MKHIIAGSGGFVGKETWRLFPDAEGYDIKWRDNVDHKSYDVCHICVPTPMKDDGSCDTSAIDDVISKIDAELYIIKSTVPPGYTKQHMKAVFSPEYVASSSPYPAPLGDITKRDFVIFGGFPHNTKKARRLYETVYPPTTKIMETDSTTAELIKLFENTAIAAKVSLCNEFFSIAQAYGCDYDTIREGVFRLDPRFTEWWTYVKEGSRGWGGHCLGKDTSNLVHSCELQGYEPKLIKDIITNNERHKSYGI